MNARKQFETAMYCARVFRGTARTRPAERVFWLQSALNSYQIARRMRDRIQGAA